jgi:hypothetical protein
MEEGGWRDRHRSFAGLESAPSGLLLGCKGGGLWNGCRLLRCALGDDYACGFCAGGLLIRLLRFGEMCRPSIVVPQRRTRDRCLGDVGVARRWWRGEVWETMRSEFRCGVELSFTGLFLADA